MHKKIKVVLDTNVLVSAIFQKPFSIPNRIYQSLKFQQFILVTSLEILREVEDVINRDFIVKRTHLTIEKRRLFIKTLKDLSIIFGRLNTLQISRDLKDDKFLACAYEAKAHYIVTGDKDLLVLKEYKSTKIISPRNFVNILLRPTK